MKCKFTFFFGYDKTFIFFFIINFIIVAVFIVLSYGFRRSWVQHEAKWERWKSVNYTLDRITSTF